MKHLYLFLLFTLLFLNLGAQQDIIIKDVISGGGYDTAPTGSVSFSVGQTLVPLAENCGGSAQNGIQQPDFPLLNLVNSFEATDINSLADTSDAYITIEWTLLEECFRDFANRCTPYPDGVLIELLAEDERIYSEIVYDASGGEGDFEGSFRHFVGPDSTVNYTLNVFIRGNGMLSCNSLTTTGATMPFQPPVDFMVSGNPDAFPDRIEMSWINKSQLSSNFLVYREANGEKELIATLVGSERIDTLFTFVDDYTLGDSLNLVNGQQYNYCIQTYNSQLDSLLEEEVCELGNTMSIDFEAALSGGEIVNLSWTNVSSYASELNIRRDGLLLKTLPASSTTYVDDDPTFGDTSTYQLDLLDENGLVILRAEDGVNFPAKGEISGYVRSPQYASIANRKVAYQARIGSTMFYDTVETDYKGYYVFPDVFYGRQADFSINAIDDTQFTFASSAVDITLDNESPVFDNINIYSTEEYPESLGSEIEIDTLYATAALDSLIFDWEYTTRGNIDEPVHFLLFREGDLLDLTDSGQPSPQQLIDMTGNANNVYRYQFIAYGFYQDSLVIATRNVIDTMPMTTSPNGLMAENNYDDLSNNVITLSWSNDSENFDGYFLYRDNALIADLSSEQTFFYDYFAAPGESFEYMLTAYRISDVNEDFLLDGESIFIESEPVSVGPVLIPDFPVLENLNATTTPGSALDLEWSLPGDASDYDNLTGFILFRDGEPIKRIVKMDKDYLIRDYKGQPGQHTYEIASYLYAADTTFVGALQTFSPSPVTILPATQPTITAVTPFPEGYVSVSIDPQYTGILQNHDGYVFFANGMPFDTLRPYEFTAYYTPNIPLNNSAVDFEVKAYRSIDGDFFYSSTQVMSATPSNQSNALTLEVPQNFSASEHIPMHVAMLWDFPDYLFATFRIFRNGNLIAQLPTEARHFYDREAIIGEKYAYSIQAEYEGEQSPVISDEGMRRGQSYITGQILAQDYSSGLYGVPVCLQEESPPGRTLERTYTDSTGFFCFQALPPSLGADNWEIAIMQDRCGLNLQSPSLVLDGKDKEQGIFYDLTNISAVPPLPLVDSVAFVTAFEQKPLIDEGALALSWLFSEGIYDGNITERGLTRLDIRDRGEFMYIIDSTGVGGIDYGYVSFPYVLEDGERSDLGLDRVRVDRTAYPILHPVEYLSALGAVNNIDNSVSLQWSHYTGKLDYYEILRNDLPLYELPADSALIFVDTTGKPDHRYIYQIRAVKQTDGGVTISESRSVEIKYPEVARPQPFTANPFPNDNAVKLNWEYEGNAVNGFRIFRNGELLVNLEGYEREYIDYTGIPGGDVAYRIIALVEREGMQYQSRATITNTTNPLLLPPANMNAAIIENKGLIELSFTYSASGVDRFRVYRINMQGGLRTLLGLVSYTPDLDGAEQTFSFLDITGVPDEDYTYEVEAESSRSGLFYQSIPAVTSPLIVYPYPPVLSTVFATTNQDNLVELSWSFESIVDLDVNVDGFVIYRLNGPSSFSGPITQETIEDYTADNNLEIIRNYRLANPGKRKFKDLFPNIYDIPIKDINYVVAGYREINGSFYYSPLFSKNGGLSLDAPILWAGGEDGTVLAWTGNRWSDDYDTGIPISVDVNSLWGSSPSSVWLSGYDDVQNVGVIYHWNGSQWSQKYSNYSGGALHGIWALNDNNVRVVGDDGILRFDGTQWIEEYTGSGGFNAIWGANEEDIWAVTNGEIYKLDEGVWNVDATLSGLFIDIHGTDRENVWTGSDNSTSVAVRWNGQSWLEQGLASKNIKGVWSTNPTTAWTAGVDGNIIKWTPNGKLIQTTGVTNNLLDILAENDDKVWAVGSGGTILRLSGTSWETIPSPTNANLAALGTAVPLVVNLVQASDGLFANRTRIEWEFFLDQDQYKNFNVYRGNELIATLDPDIFFYNDSDGIPGVEYAYTVKIVNNENTEYPGRSDIGFTKGAGQLEGQVLTLLGSVPIEGALLRAEAVIDGESYIYEELSNADGIFVLDGLFVGDNPANYTLSVTYLDHGFLEEEQTFLLSPQNPTRNNIFFFDTTSYVVQGQVVYKGNCPIDSIEVIAHQILMNNDTLSVSDMTDEEGRYNIIIDPNLSGLSKIVVEAKSVFIANNGMENQEIILHDFSPAFWELSPIKQVNTIDFEDQITYPLEIYVENVCGLPASSNGRFNIEISTRDGCFIKTEQTDFEGFASIEAPPLDELIIRVLGAEPLSLENNLVINYLEYRPITLNLRRTHIANTVFDVPMDTYVLEDLDLAAEARLVYHRPATITILEEFGEQNSCEPGLRFLTKDQPYSIDFEVTETHQGQNCTVKEGYILVNNAAADADNTKDELHFEQEFDLFETHIFNGGVPNLVDPYRKTINIKYFSDEDDLLAELTIPVVVLGENAVPGSDIIVDVNDEDGGVKFPLYILRDPPGDQSSSFISEGQTFTRSISRSFGGGFAIGIQSEFGASVSGTGGFINRSEKVGTNVQGGSTFEIAVTSNQKISTSSSSDFVGVDADVLIGVGAALQYGITEQLIYNEEECDFEKIQAIGFSPNKIKTDWLYTVGQIKQLAQQYEDQAELAGDGLLTITRGDNVLSNEDAQTELSSRADNWRKILIHHAIESVPFYNLCKEEYDVDKLWDQALFYNKGNQYRSGIGVEEGEPIKLRPGNPGPLFKHRVEKANDIRDDFCSETGIGDLEFDPEEPDYDLLNEIVFNDDLAREYEKTIRAIEYWLDSLHLGVVQVNNRIENLEEDTTFFIPKVENTTFSGGVTIEKSVTSSKKVSGKFSQKVYIDANLTLGAKGTANISVGLGLIKELADVNAKKGVSIDVDFSFDYERYKSSSSEITTGYTLSDNDVGDQYSVTAIRGRTPGHTPYFQLLGGRSSCPPEYMGEDAGPIQRDRPSIHLLDQATQSVAKSEEQFGLDPNAPASYTLRLTNNNPFGEQRDIFVYYDASSNEEGAIVRLEGGLLGSGNQSGKTYTYLNPGQPLDLPLTITRPPGKYQFEDINIIVRPNCTDGDLHLVGRERDTVTVSAFFEHPCSDISISRPGDSWVIGRRNPLPGGTPSREAMTIRIQDFTASNPLLEEVYLEFRLTGESPSPWIRMPRTVLTGDGVPPPPGQLTPDYPITGQVLQDFIDTALVFGETPYFEFIWDITNQYDDYPDGDYEIRAVAFCGADGVIFSNSVPGEIRRRTDQLFYVTEPADKIWQPGDEISVLINRNLSCAVDTSTFEVRSLDTGLLLPMDDNDVGCFPDLNKLRFIPDVPGDPNLLTYDGQLFEATVYSLNDGVNAYPDTIRWKFRVISRDFYVLDTLLETTIYQGYEGFLSTTIFNNTSSALLNYNIVNAVDYPWLEIDPVSAQIPTAVGRRVTFTVDGDLLPLGDTTAVLVLEPINAVNGGMDTIRIKVKVLATPPYWVVNPSQYDQQMIVNANYRYTTPATSQVSTDTMDLISAWIDNEIRGVASIFNASDGQSAAASVFVFGNVEDVGKPVEFRAWDADKGMEYNAYPKVGNVVDTIYFEVDNIIGTIRDPEILIIDKNKDKARYIPLNGGIANNGNRRDTWFSINSTEPDNNVNSILRELIYAQNGDVIKTQSTSAGFIEGVGWVSTNGLDTIYPENGYIIFLGDREDTIRITGYDAIYDPIALNAGWNLIGYPLQDTLGINEALIINNVSQGDVILSEPQNQYFLAPPPNPPINGLFANYDVDESAWLFSPGMDVMRPNFAYKLRVDFNTFLTYPGASTNLLSSGTVVNDSNLSQNIFNPTNPATWQVDPSQYPSSMVVTGVVEFDEVQSFDENDRVAAFVNGECRGVSPLYYVNALGQNMATLFVYGSTFGEEIDIILYDASEDQVYLNTESFSYEGNGLIGNFSAPYVFENQTRAAAYTTEDTYCEVDPVGAIAVDFVSGLEAPYNYAWSTGAITSGISELTAGTYYLTITGALGLTIEDSVVISNQEIDIPLPEIETSIENPACLGSDVVLYAIPPSPQSTIKWYDGQGNWLQNGEALLLEGLTADYTAYALTDYSGCLSELQEASIEVYQPAANYVISPAEDITTETSIEFTPSIQIEGASYVWNFGNGENSTAMSPTYQYELPGLYISSLQLTDEQGCESETNTYNVWVDAVSNILELENGIMSLEVMPNPFSFRFRAKVEVPQQANYTMSIHDMQGRLINSFEYDWSKGKHITDIELDAADGVYLLSLERMDKTINSISNEQARLVLPIVKQTVRP